MRYPMLETIRSPQQIKSLSLKELLELCKELRERIIEVVSKNGGHLGSNLGAVELTVALHKVFDSPSDMFLWDVSHQTYSHKLLTGRNDRFDTIRLTDGLCGFTDPNESPHDHFHAGHAGAALSSALGVAKTRDLCREDHHVLAILGDASLTCGVTLEALNNIDNSLQRFIVIVNDNGMSISQNVGAITHILSRLLSNPRSNRFYHSLENLVSRIPLYGKILADQGKKFTQSLKNLVSSAAFFEQYGLAYSGPIDGHDLKKLIDVLEGIKNCDQPVILHVLTEKGHGMTEGMKNNPINWHGPQPFDPKTGRIHAAAKPKPTFPKIFGKHLLEMADKDNTLVAVTPAMSLGSCLDPFQEKYPDRCIDVGIAEAHAVTYAGGIAHNRKMKVFMSIYSTFLQRALDNVFHDVCLQNIPLVFAIDRGGIATGDGATHEGIYDMGFLMEMPNMVICQPRNGHLLKELMESAFSWQLPTAIRYPNLATTESEAPIKPRLLGKGEQIADGEDLAIIALGHMCDVAMKAREILKEQGVHAAVIDPIFVKPLDQDLLRKLLKKHHRIVTLEEHSIQGGLGTAINNFLMAERTKADVCNLGIPDLFLQHGSHGDLLEQLGLSPQKVAQTILERFQIQLSVEV